MTKRPILFVLACAAGLSGIAGDAAAQSAVTAYGGIRTGSGFQRADGTSTSVDVRSRPAGTAALELPYDASRQWQWLLSHQRTRLLLGDSATPGAPTELPLDVTYLHVGGLNFFDGPAGRGPYVSGGLGLTHMSPRLPGTSSRTRGSMSVGIGYQWMPAAGGVALRTELRGYATLIRSDGAFFCSGGCTVSIRGDTMSQLEAMIGVSVGF